MGTPMFDSDQSKQRQTANRIIDSINEWTEESLVSFRSPHCIHIVRPHSLNIPALTNEGYATYMGQHLAAFRHFHCRVHEVHEDPTTNTIIMRVSSTADTDVGPYNNESMITLQFNDNGDQVTVFTEFFDSVISRDFLTKLHVGQNGTAAQIQSEKQIEGVVF